MASRRPRQKDTSHADFIRGLPCLICKDPTSTEAAHLRMSCYSLAKTEAGVGAKPDDKWLLPLCSKHHREQHSMGEQTFWQIHGYDDRAPFFLCLTLWSVTGDDEYGSLIVERN